MAQILAQLKEEKESGETRQTSVNSDIQGGNIAQFNPKIEFPTFDGTDPKGWIKKCTRYFGFYRIQDTQKVDLASLYLKGLAE